MPTCNCCCTVIQPQDTEAMFITMRGRTIRLCRDHTRGLIAMLSDLQLGLPIEVIR